MTCVSVGRVRNSAIFVGMLFQIWTKIDFLIYTSSDSSVQQKGNAQECVVYFLDEDKLVMERSPFIDPPPGGVAEKTVDATVDDTTVPTACVTSPSDTPASTQVVLKFVVLYLPS